MNDIFENYKRNQYEAGYKAGVQQMRQHGHWIIKENRFGELTLQCCVCNEIDKDFRLPHFCKFCGAIMYESEVEE